MILSNLIKTWKSDGAAFGPNKSRRRSDRSKHATSYEELDEDFMLEWKKQKKVLVFEPWIFDVERDDFSTPLKY